MHTKFQDVAHHYLGCKLIHKWSAITEIHNESVIKEFYQKSNIEGDKVEILFSGEICRWIEGKYSALPFEFSFKLIPYLLKQGFDLFNLISNNEAVI